MPNVKIVKRISIPLSGYASVYGAGTRFRDLMYFLVDLVRGGEERFPLNIEVTVTRTMEVDNVKRSRSTGESGRG